MIPFKCLGLIFKLFSSWVYPDRVKDDLSELLKEIRPGSMVIDIGAGTGILTEFAHRIRKDLHYVTLDPAFGMIRYAPSYTSKVMAVAEFLPFKKDIFDIVLIRDAIHHLDNPDKAIIETKGCMRPDSSLFMFDLNPDTIMGRIIYRIEKVFKEPSSFYSPERLSDMLKGWGFKTTINRYDWRYSIKAELGSF
ncbi:MAG TPA: SAM-dependent methyltransferase [Deltaproteobacteria bacterium]|nr:SAM-dependent methyltransferase [Deltaproteobacteria bacterium]